MPDSNEAQQITRFFFTLTPDRVLEAVESSGHPCTGRCMALNSFENRVYDVELDLDPEIARAQGSKLIPGWNRRVVKFYRPGRWSEAQILEEHAFIQDLVAAEIPAIAPLPFPGGGTLRRTPVGDMWYAIFPKIGGRAPDELTDEQLVRIGRLLGRIHNVGASRLAGHRVRITPDTFGIHNLEFLLKGTWIPLELRTRYERTVREICRFSEPIFQESASPEIRLHGDCHLGNLLWSDQGPFFLDFDDMARGPAAQDLWLLIPGRDVEARRKLDTLLSGYEEIRAFERASLRLIEPLRALRFVHYSAWIARRWQDPAFPQAFPHFGSFQYWSDETSDLEEQLRLIQNLS